MPRTPATCSNARPATDDHIEHHEDRWVPVMDNTCMQLIKTPDYWQIYVVNAAQDGAAAAYLTSGATKTDMQKSHTEPVYAVGWRDGCIQARAAHVRSVYKAQGLCAHRHDWIMQSAAGAHLNAMPARACCDPPCDSSNATMRHALSGVTKPWIWHAHLVCSLCRACTCASTLPKC